MVWPSCEARAVPRAASTFKGRALFYNALKNFTFQQLEYFDHTGIITSWNQGAERLFGYTAAEAIGQSITMLIPPDRIEEEPEILAPA